MFARILFQPDILVYLKHFTLGLLLAFIVGLQSPAFAEDWPMFGRNIQHHGRSLETSISATNAANLKLAWRSHAGAGVQSSPVVAFNAVRNQSLLYVGTSGGQVLAFNAATGARVWAYNAGGNVNTTPSVSNGVVFIPVGSRVLALNGATGALKCSYTGAGNIVASPLVIDPDDAGPQPATVYTADAGFGGIDNGGRVYAIRADTCALRWQFSGFDNPDAGSWSPPAFGRDVNGRALVLFGSSSPDNAVYAVDANTGTRVWRFQSDFVFDGDVGAGPTVVNPGVLGFTDGAVFVTGKNNITYALNLRTGAKYWDFPIASDRPDVEGRARSTAALVFNQLVLGYGQGLYGLDAATGAKRWRSADTAEVLSAVAVSGSAGSRVAIVGDLIGKIHAVAVDGAAPGSIKWNYSTGGPIYSSAAFSGGKVYIASTDGFVYGFDLAGEPAGIPQSAITSPSNNAVLANPQGNITVRGSFAGTAPRRIETAIQNTLTGKWWNRAQNSWGGYLVNNIAIAGSPWSFPFPAPLAGGAFYLQTQAVDTSNRRERTPATVEFVTEASGMPPNTTVTSPTNGQTLNIPASNTTIVIRGTAQDTGGANPGIRAVKVMVENLDHGEFFCGPPGCNQFVSDPDYRWTSAETTVNASLNGTDWTLGVPLYNHSHNYRITAYAIDNNGKLDQSRVILQFHANVN
jgi:outer membrane protein assembly factor BamB